MLKIGVLASGKGSNLQAIIDAIESGKVSATIGIVISNKSNACALLRAQRHGITSIFLDPKESKTREEYDARIVAHLEKEGVELVVLAGFMRILSPYFIKAYKSKIMNIHPALLPSFPGGHGQRQAVDYGVKISGATVHFVDEGCDTGPIILQVAVPVEDDDTEETLSARILEQEHKIYPLAIQLYAEGKLEVIGRKVTIRQK
ncbi:MAG: phosphoribosylglycinamide formyltransferase [bacterium]|nr:phosphoribosylglycinamide formyltransferase [bacterium]